jgi:hypothetical protein
VSAIWKQKSWILISHALRTFPMFKLPYGLHSVMKTAKIFLPNPMKPIQIDTSVQARQFDSASDDLLLSLSMGTLSYWIIKMSYLKDFVTWFCQSFDVFSQLWSINLNFKGINFGYILPSGLSTLWLGIMKGLEVLKPDDHPLKRHSW